MAAWKGTNLTMTTKTKPDETKTTTPENQTEVTTESETKKVDPKDSAPVTIGEKGATSKLYSDDYTVETNKNPNKRSLAPHDSLIPEKYHGIAPEVIKTMAEAEERRSEAQKQVSANKAILWNFVDAG